MMIQKQQQQQHQSFGTTDLRLMCMACFPACTNPTCRARYPGHSCKSSASPSLWWRGRDVFLVCATPAPLSGV
jgi:hypothetical protein